MKFECMSLIFMKIDLSDENSHSFDMPFSSFDFLSEMPADYFFEKTV